MEGAVLAWVIWEGFSEEMIEGSPTAVQRHQKQYIPWGTGEII